MSAKDMMRITGKTYDYRHLLKRRGGKWDAAAKSWLIVRADWEELLCSETMLGGNKRDRERRDVVLSWTAEVV